MGGSSTQRGELNLWGNARHHAKGGCSMSTVLRIGTPSKGQTALPEDAALDTRIALIQALIPLGLQAVQDVLQQEVAALAGPRHPRGGRGPPPGGRGRAQGAAGGVWRRRLL